MLTCSTLFVWLTKMHRRLSPWFHWRCLANFHSKIGSLSHQVLDYRWTNCWSVLAFCEIQINYEFTLRIYFFNRIPMILPLNFESHAQVIGVQVYFSILFSGFAGEFNEKFWTFKSEVTDTLSLDRQYQY